MAIRVFLAEDEAVVRAGIAMLIDSDPELEVAAQVANGQEVLDLVAERRPDVVVMDVRMPEVDGVEATRRLVAGARQTGQDPPPILIVTTFREDEAVFSAIEAGASGFLLKDAMPQELISAIKAVAAGQGWLDPKVCRPIFREMTRSRSSSPPDDERILYRAGDYWTVNYLGRTGHLKNARGLELLSVLLQQPGRERFVLDLVSIGSTITGEGHAGPLLDPAARAAYRRRLEELDDEAAEAEAWGDADRAARARLSRAALGEELARSLGLGGRSRVAGSAAERARVSATKAIRQSIRRIQAVHPELGLHLQRTVQTGTYCCYRPDP